MHETQPGNPGVRTSVIVTFYNQEAWVADALDSVASQSDTDLEIIVTDDGSTDGTRSSIATWASASKVGIVPCFSDTNVGLPAMLNKAVGLASGRYIMVLNGDDWLDQGRAQTQADALDASPDVDIVYSQLRVVTPDGTPTGEFVPHREVPWPEGDILRRIIRSTFIGMPSVMFRRSLVERIGPWDESLVADDFDFLLRAAASGARFKFVDGVHTNYRRHQSSLTGGQHTRLAVDRITSLTKYRKELRATEKLIGERICEIAHALHSSRVPQKYTRRYLLQCLVARPNPRTARALIECLLRLPAGSLSPRNRTHRRRGRLPSK